MFDEVCAVCIVSRWMADGLVVSRVGAVSERHKIGSEKGKFVYKFIVGSEERRRGLKWLTWWMPTGVCALCAGELLVIWS